MYTASFLSDPDFIRILYILAFGCFIYGLHLLNHPRSARRGNSPPKDRHRTERHAWQLLMRLYQPSYKRLWQPLGTNLIAEP